MNSPSDYYLDLAVLITARAKETLDQLHDLEQEEQQQWLADTRKKIRERNR